MNVLLTLQIYDSTLFSLWHHTSYNGVVVKFMSTPHNISTWSSQAKCELQKILHVINGWRIFVGVSSYPLYTVCLEWVMIWALVQHPYILKPNIWVCDDFGLHCYTPVCIVVATQQQHFLPLPIYRRLRWRDMDLDIAFGRWVTVPYNYFYTSTHIDKFERQLTVLWRKIMHTLYSWMYSHYNMSPNVSLAFPSQIW